MAAARFAEFADCSVGLKLRRGGGPVGVAAAPAAGTAIGSFNVASIKQLLEGAELECFRRHLASLSRAEKELFATRKGKTERFAGSVGDIHERSVVAENTTKSSVVQRAQAVLGSLASAR